MYIFFPRLENPHELADSALDDSDVAIIGVSGPTAAHETRNILQDVREVVRGI